MNSNRTLDYKKKYDKLKFLNSLSGWSILTMEKSNSSNRTQIGLQDTLGCPCLENNNENYSRPPTVRKQ